MTTIRPVDLHWLKGCDDPNDLCAHAGVTFVADGKTVISPDDGIWCVSAAAVFLLRTLFRDHTSESPICSRLVPHCGHSMFTSEDGKETVILGCDGGVNWWVLHKRPNVSLLFNDGTTCSLHLKQWRDAVFAFSDDVSTFYCQCARKTPAEDDAEGYATFRAEWKRLREARIP